MPYPPPFKGRHCAFSGLQFVASCDPSIKYMSNLFDHRHEAYSSKDRLDDIDDTRNGILLYSGFHCSLDKGRIAFLMVRDLLSFLFIP
jgi:hypothetical protein